MNDVHEVVKEEVFFILIKFAKNDEKHYITRCDSNTATPFCITGVTVLQSHPEYN